MNVKRDVETGSKLLDETAFGGIQVMPHGFKARAKRIEQLNAEAPGARPVDQQKPPKDGMPVRPAFDVLPQAVEGAVGLANVKGHGRFRSGCRAFITDQVQIIGSPAWRAGREGEKFTEGECDFPGRAGSGVHTGQLYIR